MKETPAKSKYGDAGLNVLSAAAYGLRPVMANVPAPTSESVTQPEIDETFGPDVFANTSPDTLVPVNANSNSAACATPVADRASATAPPAKSLDRNREVMGRLGVGYKLKHLLWLDSAVPNPPAIRLARPILAAPVTNAREIFALLPIAGRPTPSSGRTRSAPQKQSARRTRPGGRFGEDVLVDPASAIADDRRRRISGCGCGAKPSRRPCRGRPAAAPSRRVPARR